MTTEPWVDNLARDKLSRYAKNKNVSAYRSKLSESIRDILSIKRGSRASDALLRNLPSPAPRYFLSLHYNSRILREWLRVTGDDQNGADAYGDNCFSPTEIQHLKDVYCWDEKSGHLLVDNLVKKSFLVAFGDSFPRHKHLFEWQMTNASCKTWFEFARKHLLWFVNRGRTANTKYSGPVEGDWPVGFKLPAMGLWRPLRTELVAGKKKANVWHRKDIGTRSFVLTFFYSIGAHGGRGTHKYDHFVLAVPVLDDPAFDQYAAPEEKKGRSNTLLNRAKLGSLAFVCFGAQGWGKPEFDCIRERLEEMAESLVRELAYFELQQVPVDVRFATSDEDKIRQACDVDHEGKADAIENKQLQSLDAFHGRWPSLVKDLLPRKYNFQALEEASPFWKKLVHSEQLVGASDRYWNLIKELKHVAESFLHNATRKPEKRESQAVFFYSEPGCGKENLAALVHFITVLGLLNKRGTALLHTGVPQTDIQALRRYRDTAVTFESAKPLRNLIEATRGRIKVSNAKKADPLFSYQATSAANFSTREDFLKSFLGYYDDSGITAKSRIGPFLAAHLLRGSVFLDEFNTFADPKWANVFLRLFDKPYEAEIPGRNPSAMRNLSVLMICASNWSREELIQRGFNSAVIYRLTKRYLVVPPLRERPVDIAVFVNARLRGYNQTVADKPERRSVVKRIAPDAIRLICELPWPDNYRGVQALLDDVLELRSSRGISDSTLSFEQVLEGLRRRELLMLQPYRDQPRQLRSEGL